VFYGYLRFSAHIKNIFLYLHFFLIRWSNYSNSGENWLSNKTVLLIIVRLFFFFLVFCFVILNIGIMRRFISIYWYLLISHIKEPQYGFYASPPVFTTSHRTIIEVNPVGDLTNVRKRSNENVNVFCFCFSHFIAISL